MLISKLPQITASIERGNSWYALREPRSGKWHFSDNLEQSTQRAKQIARSSKMDTTVFRMLPSTDTCTKDSYLFIRKILRSPGPSEQPISWGRTDSLQAAEMLRDISSGPTPCFGLLSELTIKAGTESE